ncbi:MAG: hypothetical protein FWC72_01055 [Oscillospiraceae bacterium]|nr:hypothetical protein [Oscillospiraceae bacterium]
MADDVKAGEHSSPLRYVGLAYRAGKLAVGVEAVNEAVFLKRARLICTASDASERVVEGAERMPERCNGLYAAIPFTRTALGKALGLTECGIVAFLDPGLAWGFGKRLDEIDTGRYGALFAELTSRRDRAVRRRGKKHGESGKRRTKQ